MWKIGLKPRIEMLDNEFPNGLKQYMRNKYIKFQLVPSYWHIRNVDKREISKWREHFIAGLISLYPLFSMHLWCCLIKESMKTVNLLHPYRINQILSDETQLNRVFDFNVTLMVLPVKNYSYKK